MFKPGQTFVIAEAGVNHNGSVERALEMIDVAAAARADAVKFQTFVTESVISRSAPKADYQLRTTTPSESQFDMVKKLELDAEAHRLLLERARAKGIQFLSTPFDFESLELLAGRFDLPLLKIPSGEISNAPLLLRAAQTGKPLIVSTGMCTLADIELALGVLAFGYVRPVAPPSVSAFREAYASREGQAALQEMITVLHCTTEYPAPFAEINLRAMDTLKSAFGLRVGLSDHSQGISVPIAAAARGATVVEKHFTLDRTLPGPDHAASLEPHELEQMVRSIREVEAALGVLSKVPTSSESKNLGIARKSLVAAEAIAAGEVFTEENLTAKRPGAGVPPYLFWNFLGKRANRSYQKDEIIDGDSYL